MLPVCVTDAPQLDFKAGEFSRENLLCHRYRCHVGWLRREAFHACICNIIHINFFFFTHVIVEFEHDRCSGPRQDHFEPASQQRMEWVCSLAALVRNLLLVLCGRAADNVVKQSRSKFSLAQRQIYAIHHRRQDDLLGRALE